MSERNIRAITVQAVFNDACDGVIRLVNDAQKFGFTLRALQMDAALDEPVAELSLLVPAGTSLDDLASRFGRHPAVKDALVRVPDDVIAFDLSGMRE